MGLMNFSDEKMRRIPVCFETIFLDIWLATNY
jgi:hypothetical protein